MQILEKAISLPLRIISIHFIIATHYTSLSKCQLLLYAKLISEYI